MSLVVPSAVNGGLLIDKPAGMTSSDVLRQLKRKFKIERIGHSGTLDPMATGLLIVLLGKATRLQDLFLNSAKIYSGKIRLGVATDTDDITGKVIAEDSAPAFTKAAPEETLQKIKTAFVGKIQQIPPKFSAIRVDGERSYDLARKGEAPELKAREVEVFDLELNFENPTTLNYRAKVSKGTYIRSLARDIGEFLGSCGTLESIRREVSGAFSITDAHPLDALLSAEALDNFTLGYERLLSEIPRVEVSAADFERLSFGDQRPLLGLGRAESELAALYVKSGDFRGLIEINPAGMWQIRGLF